MLPQKQIAFWLDNQDLTWIPPIKIRTGTGRFPKFPNNK
jgi:hypothetical protein